MAFFRSSSLKAKRIFCFIFSILEKKKKRPCPNYFHHPLFEGRLKITPVIMISSKRKNILLDLCLGNTFVLFGKHPVVCFSLFLSFFPSLSLSISLSLSLSLPLFLPLSFSLYFFFSLSFSLSLSLSLPLSLPLTLSLFFFFFSISLFLYLLFSLFLPLSLSLSNNLIIVIT